MSRRKVLWVISLVIAVPAATVVWWLASPLFISNTVEERFPAANAGSQADSMPEGALAVKRGSLRDADSFHKGSGEVVLYRLPDGSHLLRLENINVTNGPDLYVFLSPHASPTNQQQVYTAGYGNLGKLRGNIGSLTYALPADVNPSQQRSAIIYCLAFHVVFSVAALQ